MLSFKIKKLLRKIMQTVNLGNILTVPALGIGTWAWGDSFFWSYGKDYGKDQLQEAFETAISEGITLFDTAEIYGLGESERLLGEFNQKTDQNIVIASKYFPLPWRFNQKAVEEALTASLERLKVEQIALYQVHWPFQFLMSDRTLMQALAKEVKRGRILTVGVSNYSAQQMREAYNYLKEEGIPLAVNQVCYSLLNRKIENNGILETAKELNITILAYSPLAQGLLTGKYQPENPIKPLGARQLDPRFTQKGLTRLDPLLKLLQELAEKYQKTPAQIALNWLINQGDVMPIPGAKTANQAKDNSGALGWNLIPDDLTQLSSCAKLIS
jgi:aryl-alcohol dehydrogenase-like predicted oxidoreductase